jgi:hypothetical protein
MEDTSQDRQRDHQDVQGPAGRAHEALTVKKSTTQQNRKRKMEALKHEMITYERSKEAFQSEPKELKGAAS